MTILLGIFFQPSSPVLPSGPSLLNMPIWPIQL